MKCVNCPGIKTLSYEDLIQKLPEHASAVWNIGMSYFIAYFTHLKETHRITGFLDFFDHLVF
jgi:hypothetical protein